MANVNRTQASVPRQISLDESKMREKLNVNLKTTNGPVSVVRSTRGYTVAIQHG